jgi:hypothetical protein
VGLGPLKNYGYIGAAQLVLVTIAMMVMEVDSVVGNAQYPGLVSRIDWTNFHQAKRSSWIWPLGSNGTGTYAKRSCRARVADVVALRRAGGGSVNEKLLSVFDVLVQQRREATAPKWRRGLLLILLSRSMPGLGFH